MRSVTTVSIAIALGGFAGGCQSLSTSEATQALSGAIFTTLPDGTRVNANIYDSKDDVYLDGGPGDQAPGGAAALPAGDYYFEVTDPGCKELLSTDAITERMFTVDENGQIVDASGHVTGLDVDHDALTVQLMPYNDTPNNGGEYKVHITAVEDYNPSAQNSCFGFVANDSKTDNYKVEEVVPPPPPPPCCGDGNLDEGEECDDGNTVDGDGCSSTCTIEPPPPPPPCCGDGYVDEGEECDDGNTVSGDGCSSTCTIEPPPPPPSCCGDGYVDPGEECDDGNTVNGDGCSSTCLCEPVVTGITAE